ncbi:MAG: hypothetical protein R3F48_06075 [Candidatus Zixiibacteriota bacterium]
MTDKSSKQLAKSWPYRRYNEFERELRDAAAKWFSKNKYATNTRMPYCLKSHGDWPQNIICEEVANYIHQQSEENKGKDSFPLHKYLHHGLSSQAMIFNLVGPLVVRDDLEPLRKVSENIGLPWPDGDIEASFEFDDRDVFNEDRRQPTSIDLAVCGEKSRVFIEAKLKENEFGGCSVFSGGDCDGRNPVLYGRDGCYLHNIGRKYWELMAKFGFDKTALASGPICPFTNYYQFFRETLFALKKNGCFVLLHDERNPAFLRASEYGCEAGLWPFLTSFVPKEHAAKIGRVTIQQLVDKIEDSGRHHDWINEFKLKYGII